MLRRVIMGTSGGGPAIAVIPARFARITRANFLPASIIPFLTGAALAFREGAVVTPGRFLLGLCGVISAHLAGNLCNDYCDARYGADTGAGRSPFFGGSGVIQEGLVTAGQVLSLAIGFFAVSALCGIILFCMTSDPILILIMVVAAVLTVSYTARPLSLAYRGLGEIDIMLLFGFFLVTASHYLFAGRFSLSASIASLPVTFLIGAVIVCNEVPDLERDRRAGKHTLVWLVRRDRAYLLYGGALSLSYAGVLLAVLGGVAHPLSLALAVCYVPGIMSFFILEKRSGEPAVLVKASAMTIALHALVGTGMIVGIVGR